MSRLRSVLRSVLVLTVIAAAVTAILAVTNLMTAETIAAREKEAAQQACAEVIAAESFEEKPLPGGEGSYYEAKNGQTLCGYVFTAQVTGKSSGLTVMTGVDTEGKVTGCAIVSDNETAGYVDKVKKGGLFERLAGVSEQTVDGVDGVSQATRTSNGVKKGVRAALEYYREVTG